MEGSAQVQKVLENQGERINQVFLALNLMLVLNTNAVSNRNNLL